MEDKSTLQNFYSEIVCTGLASTSFSQIQRQLTPGVGNTDLCVMQIIASILMLIASAIAITVTFPMAASEVIGYSIITIFLLAAVTGLGTLGVSQTLWYNRGPKLRQYNRDNNKRWKLLRTRVKRLKDCTHKLCLAVECGAVPSESIPALLAPLKDEWMRLTAEDGLIRAEISRIVAPEVAKTKHADALAKLNSKEQALVELDNRLKHIVAARDDVPPESVTLQVAPLTEIALAMRQIQDKRDQLLSGETETPAELPPGPTT